jgi:hypothetical protein
MFIYEWILTGFLNIVRQYFKTSSDHFRLLNQFVIRNNPVINYCKTRKQTIYFH